MLGARRFAVEAWTCAIWSWDQPKPPRTIGLLSGACGTLSFTVDALTSTELWEDAREMPGTLEETLQSRDGFQDTIRFLDSRSPGRLVATGNGAAYYVAHALWLASLVGKPCDLRVVAVPAGLLRNGDFRWRPGDVLLAISTSGELRDVIELAQDDSQLPFAAITSRADSALASHAGARALVSVASQRAVTHTQGYVGNLVTALALWAELTADDELARAVAQAPDLCASALGTTDAWLPGALGDIHDPPAAVVFGSGCAWTGALEGALLLKELSRLPAEGVETREGATSASFGISRGSLAMSLAWGGDPLAREAEAVCQAMGASLIGMPSIDLPDARLAPLAFFPPTLAFAIGLALRRGKDVDRPEWTDSYFGTVRVSLDGASAGPGSPNGNDQSDAD